MTRRVALPVVLAAFLLLAGGAQTARAATCSDYANQADAQRAADTRDADGDGIYCEALPCPCLKPRGGGGGGGTDRPPARRRPRATSFSARITAVVDGDTIKVRSDDRRSYTVRLIGIDTPETKRPGVGVECGGREATASMLRLAFSAPTDGDGDGLLDRQGGQGKRVRVTTDPTQDRTDRYGRLLAYARTGGTELGAAQLSAGWAKVYVFERPFRELGRFRAAESAARLAGRGAWGACGGNFHRAGAAAVGRGGVAPSRSRIAPAGQPVSGAQAGCSRREALLHLRRTGRVSPRSGVGRAVGGRVDRFVCSDFTGDGRPDLALAITLGGSGANVYWAVLRRLPSGRLSVDVFRRGTRIGMRLESPTEFAVVEPIIGPNDDFCCEVSGFRYRRFGWDGARFVLRVEEVLPGSTYRDTPSGFY